MRTATIDRCVDDFESLWSLPSRTACLWCWALLSRSSLRVGSCSDARRPLSRECLRRCYGCDARRVRASEPGKELSQSCQSSNFLKQSFSLQVWTTHGLGESLNWGGQSGAAGTRRVVELSPRLSLRRDKTASREPNASQLDRFVKWKRVIGLRGKSKMSERRFPFSKTGLRGSLEVFDLPHPAGQWVPSGENLGHQPSLYPCEGCPPSRVARRWARPCNEGGRVPVMTRAMVGKPRRTWCWPSVRLRSKERQRSTPLLHRADFERGRKA
jgi:hypothetical protein